MHPRAVWARVSEVESSGRAETAGQSIMPGESTKITLLTASRFRTCAQCRRRRALSRGAQAWRAGGRARGRASRGAGCWARQARLELHVGYQHVAEVAQRHEAEVGVPYEGGPVLVRVLEAGRDEREGVVRRRDAALLHLAPDEVVDEGGLPGRVVSEEQHHRPRGDYLALPALGHLRRLRASGVVRACGRVGRVHTCGRGPIMRSLIGSRMDW